MAFSRHPRLRPGFSALAVGALLALLALPAGASAGSNSKGTTLGDGEPGTLTVKCPGGQLATGGGFKATPPDLGGSAALLVNESRKLGQSSWRVSGTSLGLASATLTAFVYCRGDAPETTQRSSGPSTTVADAGCLGSGNALAGGFFMNGNFLVGEAVLDSFRANSQAWRTRNISGSTLTSYAYCADVKAPRAMPQSAPASTSGSLVTSLSRECQPGTRAGAGGFIQPDWTPADGNPTFTVYESYRVGKRWRASGLYTSSPPGPARLTSVAYCS